VQIDRQVVAAALTTNAPVTQQVPAGVHAVAVASGGRSLIPSNDVNFNAGTTNFMYLVGSATDNSLVWLAQTVDGLGVAPFAVRSGEGGLPTQHEFPYLQVSLLALLAIVFVSVAARSSRTPNRWLATRRWIAAGGVAASVAGMASATQWAGSRVGDAGSLATPSDAGTTQQKLATRAASKRDRPILGALATTSARLEDRPARVGPAPTSVAIDGFGIRAPIVAVGADPLTTEMDLPPDPAVAAWYAPGPSPGQTGSAVLAGHVAYHEQLGVFLGLRRVEPGARIRVDYDDGSTRWFIVTARRSFAKPDLPVTDLFRRDGLSSLALITCGGQYNRTTRSYSDNVVIYARPETPDIPVS
jgi:sortase (surface protein transpeptidase)